MSSANYAYAGGANRTDGTAGSAIVAQVNGDDKTTTAFKLKTTHDGGGDLDSSDINLIFFGA